MSIPVWPSDLPRYMEREPFSRRLASGRRLGRSDSGPPASRRRFSRAARPVSGAFILTSAQLSRFWRFWDEAIADGTLPFWLPNQLIHGMPILTAGGVPLLLPSGVPLLTSAWWLVKFGEEDPVETAIGGSYRRLSVSLLEMP